jgi:alanine-glyoxylate transaminase/serine-glyoxylate transaminase/serine-pyruvate transaminase
MLMGTLAGVEMGLGLARVPHKKGGVLAAMEHLAAQAESKQSSRRAA